MEENINGYEYLELNENEQLENNDEELAKIVVEKLYKMPFKIVNNYINLNLKDTNPEFFLFELASFFNKYEYYPDIDLIMNLFEKNLLFNKNVEIFLNKYKKYIINGYIDRVTNDNFIINVIDFYCSENNIEIKFIDNELELDTKDIYFSECGCFRVLTKEEEKEYILKIKAGDEKARKEFIEHNLKLVINIAKGFKTNSISFLDLVQEGNMGLMKAITKFDLEKGYKFSTYATPWIKSYINKYITQNNSIIKISFRMNEKIRLYKKTISLLWEKLGREPNIKEIADSMGCSIDDVKKIERSQAKVLSISDKNYNDGDLDIESIIPDSNDLPEDVLEKSSMEDYINELLYNSNLTEREIEIIKLRYGFYNNIVYTYDEIGKKYGCTREWIRQKEKRILIKLRKSKLSTRLCEYTNDPKESKEILTKSQKVSSTKLLFKDTSNKTNAFYDLFPGNSVREVNEAIRNLSKDELRILQKYYNSILSIDEKNFLYKILIPKIQNNLKNQKREIEITYDDCKKALVIYESEYKNTLPDIESIEAIIILFSLGLVNGYNYDSYSLSKYFNLNIDKINEILSKGENYFYPLILKKN